MLIRANPVMNDYFFSILHESYNADVDSRGRGLHNVHDLIQLGCT